MHLISPTTTCGGHIQNAYPEHSLAHANPRLCPGSKDPGERETAQQYGWLWAGAEVHLLALLACKEHRRRKESKPQMECCPAPAPESCSSCLGPVWVEHHGHGRTGNRREPLAASPPASGVVAEDWLRVAWACTWMDTCPPSIMSQAGWCQVRGTRVHTPLLTLRQGEDRCRRHSEACAFHTPLLLTLPVPAYSCSVLTNGRRKVERQLSLRLHSTGPQTSQAITHETSSLP